jgi:hypothetical protein
MGQECAGKGNQLLLHDTKDANRQKPIATRIVAHGFSSLKSATVSSPLKSEIQASSTKRRSKPASSSLDGPLSNTFLNSNSPYRGAHEIPDYTLWSLFIKPGNENVNSGVEPLRKDITVKGYSETRPVAGNKTEQGRAENRRIELLIVNY